MSVKKESESSEMEKELDKFKQDFGKLNKTLNNLKERMDGIEAEEREREREREEEAAQEFYEDAAQLFEADPLGRLGLFRPKSQKVMKPCFGPTGASMGYAVSSPPKKRTKKKAKAKYGGDRRQ